MVGGAYLEQQLCCYSCHASKCIHDKCARARVCVCVCAEVVKVNVHISYRGRTLTMGDA